MSTATKIGCAHCSDEFDTDEELLEHASKQHPEKLRRTSQTKKAEQTTLVNVILDKSGSMSSKVADIIGGFNTYIDELKKDAATEYLFTLTLFDTSFVERYLAEPLSSVKNLDDKTYRPEGNTALNDAIGRTIKLIETDSHKSDKIITVIMTDGEENSSHEYSHQAVKDLIEAKEKDGWGVHFPWGLAGCMESGDELWHRRIERRKVRHGQLPRDVRRRGARNDVRFGWRRTHDIMFRGNAVEDDAECESACQQIASAATD